MIAEKPNTAPPYDPSLVPEKYRQILAKYREPDLKRSVWQLASTLFLFTALYSGMWFVATQTTHWWLTLLLALPTAGMLIRLFIIHHDCGHGSFFKSKRANDFFGFIFGALTMTPYQAWRWSHAMHHAGSGDLDRRGHGDIPTLTVAEYRALSPLKRLAYRVYRNPIVMFVIIPVVLFVVIQRFSYDLPKGAKKARASVFWTNVVLAVWIGVGCWLGGVGPFLLIHLPLLAMATSIGMWLFYVQHQHDGAYWKHQPEWNYAEAALKGSSYYELPGFLQWMTASIGLHHIHHLDSRIPNYRLQECFEENPQFQELAHRLTLLSSLRCIFVKLWDEETGRMVGFRSVA